jgi:hypothetical protein
MRHKKIYIVKNSCFGNFQLEVSAVVEESGVGKEIDIDQLESIQ